jgi:UDP-glucose 6-dehydrogenase
MFSYADNHTDPRCSYAENSYRATILAFLDEWSLFAKQNGVDLTKVIKAIKVRPTHSNMIFPGPCIGGYCLPKDGGLGMWAYKHILGWDANIFKTTPAAINVNDTRELRVAQMTRDALRNLDRPIAAAVILAVRHQQYLALKPDDVVRQVGKAAAIIDCFGILDEAAIKRYFEMGCEVKGLGRGQVNRIKKTVQRA